MNSPEKYAQMLMKSWGNTGMARKIAKDCQIASTGTENARFWELVLSIVSKVK